MDYPSLQSPGVTPFRMMVVLVTVCLIPTFIIHPYRVIQHQMEQKADFIVPLLYLTPYFIIAFCIFQYSSYSTIAFSQYPLVTALLYGSMFAEINIYIMTSHILHRPLDMLRRYVSLSQLFTTPLITSLL